MVPFKPCNFCVKHFSISSIFFKILPKIKMEHSVYLYTFALSKLTGPTYTLEPVKHTSK